jgi:hypothetical protein
VSASADHFDRRFDGMETIVITPEQRRAPLGAFGTAPFGSADRPPAVVSLFENLIDHGHRASADDAAEHPVKHPHVCLLRSFANSHCSGSVR